MTNQLHREKSIADASAFTIRFEDITRGDLALVGGKGANLGAMTRAGIPVPPGFCVTATAYERFVAGLEGERLFARLDAVGGTHADEARIAATAMREALEAIVVPPAVERAVIDAWTTLGREHAYAVRSSATAEDLPGASFAGQQDTYLNVRGQEALLDAVRRCWISLFTDRAVLYRAKNGFGHRAVKLCVVVQRMIEPDASGIMFTADPATGHRHTISIDAGFGLGEALVSGLINADLYRFDRRARRVTLARPGDKRFAMRAKPDGGTFREDLDDVRRVSRVLSDEQVGALAAAAENIERFYDGVPQDIEWCLRDGAVFIVQARPITSLFPVPERGSAGESLRVYVSFGHIQMMLDPMPTMAIDLWKFFIPVGKGSVPDREQPALRSPVARSSGSRLFLDATGVLAVPRLRRVVLGVLGHIYRDIALGVEALTKREGFVDDPLSFGDIAAQAATLVGPVFLRVPLLWVRGEAAANASEADRIFDAVVEQAKQRISQAPEGSARVRCIAHEFNSLFTSVRVAIARVMAGILAHKALERLATGPWAIEVRDEVTNLLRGLPGNVTTTMDLAVGDLSDLASASPALVALLRSSSTTLETLREAADQTEGCAAFLQAFDRFIERYGDRGVAEIDVSRSRWRDDPSVLLRVIAGGLSSDRAPGSHRQHHAQQVAIGEAAVEALASAAARDSARRGRLVRRLATVARSGMGLREHPKWAIVRMLGLVRAELIRSGKTLLDRGQIDRVDDVFHLDVDELARALDDRSASLRETIASRREAFERDRHKRPPFVLSSEGESPVLEVDRTGLPPGALVGTAASAGVVEGVARVIHDPQREVLQHGEILVAECTDPGWTPLFVHAAGVVTEVGGLMTHGAVVAREYGIPAVVSVKDATTKFTTGQRIRVDGTRGVVEPIEPTNSTAGAS